MELVHIAEVAVEHAAFSFDEKFSYIIPEKLVPFAVRGCRVMIPFGAGKNLRQGMIFSVYTSELKDIKHPLKSISILVDDEPILSEELMELTEWIKENTFSPYFDIIKSMIPSSLHMVSKQRFTLALETDPYTRYFEKKKYASTEELKKEFGLTTAKLMKLVSSGILDVADEVKRKYTDDKITMIKLSGMDSDRKLSLKQQSLVDYLKKIGQTSVKDACYMAGVTKSVADNLVRYGVAENFFEPKDKSPYEYTDKKVFDLPKLSGDQKEIYDDILPMMEEERAQGVLLHGVTGSGKTNVYMHLIKKVIDSGKKAMVLVPEISLTPQLVTVFFRCFGNRVGVVHSGLSAGEKLDQYRKIRNVKADIVVGTRSAVFSPIDNIGIIVVDEEQESSYYSDSSPRYNAKDVAKFRCSKNNAIMLLCSATPSIESYYRAKIGQYKLFTLNERFNNAILPSVSVVDMRDEIRAGNTTGISRVMREKIDECLSDGNQAILLLNKRGYHRYVSCMECGEVIKCPSCSIALTYHSVNNSLMCHYCGHVEPMVTKCKVCGSDKIQSQGSGTQKIEEELGLLYPDKKMIRMDADTTSKKMSHQKIIEDFGMGKYDILVGTQMIAKGLDFDRVQLVGVLNGDQMLFGDDFRSYERTFSLLTQVIGRSGRRDTEGSAVIQTMTPDHEVINLAAKQDYETFYNQEIPIRKATMFPPFCSICTIGISAQRDRDAAEGSKRLMEILKCEFSKEKRIPIIAIGPFQNGIYKLNNRYRMKILLKCKNNKKFRQILGCVINEFTKDNNSSMLRVVVDINPESM